MRTNTATLKPMNSLNALHNFARLTRTGDITPESVKAAVGPAPEKQKFLAGLQHIMSQVAQGKPVDEITEHARTHVAQKTRDYQKNQTPTPGNEPTKNKNHER